MPRIPELDSLKFSYEQKRVHDAIASGPRGSVRGPLAVWLNRVNLADKAQQLGRYCRYDSSLTPRLSELAILVTARIWDASYEWQAHEQPARNAGLPENVIASLKNDEQPAFVADDESLVYRFARELHLQRKVSDGLYQEAEEILGRDALIDLVGLLGYYTLISMTINAFEITS
jgi:4-carboxymuconolactone decarboxylase